MSANDTKYYAANTTGELNKVLSSKLNLVFDWIKQVSTKHLKEKNILFQSVVMFQS